MRNAKYVEVKEYGCNENGFFVAKKFSESLSENEYFYDPPTNESFGGGSRFMDDPYETKYVYVAPSSLANGGEGVFLKKPIPKDRIACFYSLYLYRGPDQVEMYNDRYLLNSSLSDDYRRQCKKYSLGLSSYNGKIDLIPNLDSNPLPTVGPKVNHHFFKSNSGK